MPELKVRISAEASLAGIDQAIAKTEKEIAVLKALGQTGTSTYTNLAAKLQQLQVAQTQYNATLQRQAQLQAQVNANYAKQQASNVAAIAGGSVPGSLAGLAGAAGVNAVGGAMHNAAGKALTFSGALSKVWSAMRGISYAIPGIGIAGLVGLMVGAVTWLVKMAFGLDGVKVSLADLREKLNAVKDSFRTSNVEAAAFQRSMDAIKPAQDGVVESLQKHIDSHDAYFKFMEEKIEKEKELALAQAEAIQDPVQRELRQSEISAEFNERKRKLTAENVTGRQTLKDKMLLLEDENIRGALPGLVEQRIEQEEVKKRADAANKAAQQNLAATRKAAEERAKMEEERGFFGKAFAGTDDARTGRLIKEQAVAAERAAERAQKQSDIEKENTERLRNAEKIARERLAKIEPDLGEARKRVQSGGLTTEAKRALEIQSTEAQAERAKSVSDASKLATRIKEQLEKTEDEINKLATDLKNVNRNRLNALKEERAEQLRQLQEAQDAIRKLKSPTSNTRLP